MGRILGGGWSESEAFSLSVFFRGGDWSESESCLLWVPFALDDLRESGEGFLLDDELGFFLAGDESINEKILSKCFNKRM